MDSATGRDANGVVGSAEKGRRQKVELLQEAIHGLLQEKRSKQPQLGEEKGSMVAKDQEEDLLLSSLLSKLDAHDKGADLNNVEPNSFHANSDPRHCESSQEAPSLGDIAKDLNKIQRQNMITHILLGTVIVMTGVWQFNEVSFLLAVQRKLSNPFKSLGELIKGVLKGRGRKPVIEAPPLPPVGIPDITRHDLPMLVISSPDG